MIYVTHGDKARSPSKASGFEPPKLCIDEICGDGDLYCRKQPTAFCHTNSASWKVRTFVNKVTYHSEAGYNVLR